MGLLQDLTKLNQKMTREDAIQIVQKLLKTNRLDGTGLSQVWDFLKQPVTLAEFLGWEEGQEYEWRGDIFRINSDILQVWDKDDERWYDSTEELNDYLRLRQSKRVEKKTKDELLNELQELVSSERINDIIKQLREVE